MGVESGHIVAAYDEEMQQLTRLFSRMGGLAEKQLADALTAVERRDSDLAKTVKDSDKAIDDLEHEIDALVVRMLALRQPMANDLRYIISTLRTAADIERVGDYSKNIGKRTIAMNTLLAPPMLRGVVRLGRLVQNMLKKVLDAYAQSDIQKAVEVWEADEEVDALHTSLFRELLTYMMEDPRHITPCTHLLFIAKNLERIGDHATNIAETVHYHVEGVPLADRRPKADASNYETVEPDEEDGA